MQKVSWVGILFILFGAAAADSADILPSIVLISLGMAIIAGGIIWEKHHFF